MNKEIKEILDKLQYVANNQIIEYDTSLNPDNVDENICPLTSNECVQLLNHITNLREDLKYQKEMYDEYCDKHTKLMQAYSNLKKENEILNKGIVYAKRIEKDYKTRFDNAIELIKDTKEYFHDGIDEELLDILEKRL